MSFEGAAFNPFSAARFAPGALPWLGDDLDELLGRVLSPGSRHQILGCHGSGKSTLLVELERRARAAGWSVARVRGSRGLAGLDAGARLWLVDEYEELSRWERLRLRLRLLLCRGGRALVVTAHRDVGFATLCRRAVTPELARRVVDQLVAGRGFRAPGPGELALALGRNAGNLREVLFELYDQVERNAADRRALR